MKIKPFVGVDELRFGFTKDEALECLGMYDQCISYANGEISQNEVWKYTKLGIELTFFGMDNYHLTAITLFSLKTEIEGINPIGKLEHELTTLFPLMRSDGKPDFDRIKKISMHLTHTDPAPNSYQGAFNNLPQICT